MLINVNVNNKMLGVLIKGGGEVSHCVLEGRFKFPFF